jgi:hypothetical protein
VHYLVTHFDVNGPQPTFDRAAANDSFEPSLLICCDAADVRYAEVSQKFGKTYCDFAKGLSKHFSTNWPIDLLG